VGPRRRRPRVFISYSHGSARHKQRVLALAAGLRDDQVDARIDQYVEGSPPEGWPRWMYNEIEDADAVIVVCTEPYTRRALGRETPGRGLGATWEGAIITQALYDAQARNTKFIPVIFGPGDAEAIPNFLKGATHYNARTKTGYNALCRHLTGQHDTPMPRLGSGMSARQSGSPRPRTASASVEDVCEGRTPIHLGGRRVLARPAPGRECSPGDAPKGMG